MSPHTTNAASAIITKKRNGLNSLANGSETTTGNALMAILMGTRLHLRPAAVKNVVSRVSNKFVTDMA
jgi:hypothetical protein